MSIFKRVSLAESQYEGARRTVLVADDNAHNRQLLQDLLEPLGFEVHTACDGQQGSGAGSATDGHRDEPGHADQDRLRGRPGDPPIYRSLYQIFREREQG
jgi:hypothetical protein